MDKRESRLLRILDAHVCALQAVRERGLNALLADETLLLATERRLQIVVQATIDLALHRAVASGLRAPERHAGAFRVQSQSQGLDPALGAALPGRWD